MDLKIKGCRALVTGASAGIGAGIAEVLAGEGVHLVLAARNMERLQRVADVIASRCHAAPYLLRADLANEQETARLAGTACEVLGGIDILVNCAGGSRPFRGDASENEWAEAITLNFTAMRRLALAVLPGMVKRRYGRIINLSGSMEPRGVNGANVAKGALHLWSKGLSCEVARDGVTINCVAPGRIESDQVRNSLHPTQESRDAFIRQHIPAGKFGDPQDVGHLVAFLCSPLACYITGAVIPVDGGMHYFAH